MDIFADTCTVIKMIPQMWNLNKNDSMYTNTNIYVICFSLEFFFRQTPKPL